MIDQNPLLDQVFCFRIHSTWVKSNSIKVFTSMLERKSNSNRFQITHLKIFGANLRLTLTTKLWKWQMMIKFLSKSYKIELRFRERPCRIKQSILSQSRKILKFWRLLVSTSVRSMLFSVNKMSSCKKSITKILQFWKNWNLTTPQPSESLNF